MMECGVPDGVKTLRNEEELIEGGAEAQASDNRSKQKPQVATLLVVKNKQTKIQVETILVPQRHVTEEAGGDSGTKISLVDEGGQYGCVQAVDLEHEEAIEQQTMRLSALDCGEQHEVGSRGTGDGGRASLMKEVDEKDSRGGMQRCGLQSTMKMGPVTWVQRMTREVRYMTSPGRFWTSRSTSGVEMREHHTSVRELSTRVSHRMWVWWMTRQGEQQSGLWNTVE